MLQSFLLEFRHLSLDHPGIDPVAPHLIIGALPLQLPEQALIPRLQALRCGAGALRQAALTSGSGSSPGTTADPGPGPPSPRPGTSAPASRNDPARGHRSLGSLDHARGSPAPQMRRLGRAPRIVRGLRLVIDQLLLPPLVLQHDQFLSGIKLLIEEVGDQGMDLAVTDPLRVVQRVADHADGDPLTMLLTSGRRPINLGQVRAVSQVEDRSEDQPLYRRGWCGRSFPGLGERSPARESVRVPPSDRAMLISSSLEAHDLRVQRPGSLSL